MPQQRYQQVTSVDGYGNVETVLQWCALAGVDLERRYDEPRLRFTPRRTPPAEEGDPSRR